MNTKARFRIVKSKKWIDFPSRERKRGRDDFLVGAKLLRAFKKEHGGSLQHGKRKTVRPLSSKHPLHLILKSSGNSFFNPSQRAIEKLIHHQARKYQIQIYDLSLNWSHIHALIKIPNRQAYKYFIRTLTAEIVKLLSKITGKDLKGLFDLPPYTRIVTWGREFKGVLDYILKNQLEAWGLKSKNTNNNKEQKCRSNQS